MYTLGGGIHEEQGWGRADETYAVKEELAAYGVEPQWFGLGDRDFATHIVRTQMLDAGYPLSAVTEALCARWQPGRAAAADERRPGRDPRGHRGRAPGGGPSTSRSGGCGCTPRCRRMRSCRSAPRTPSPRPACWRPSPTPTCAPAAVQPGRQRSARSWPCPASATRWRRPRHPSSGVSPIIGGAPVRGMADACLTAIGVETVAAAVARALRRRLLDGWLVAEERRRRGRAASPSRHRRPWPAAADERPGGHPGDRAGGPRPGAGAAPVIDPASRLEVLRVPDLPEVRRGRRPRRADRRRRRATCRRRRRRRHLQDRQQGRGPVARSRRPRGGHRRRDRAGGGPARGDPRSSRPGTAWSWPRPASTPPTPRPAPCCCCPRTPTPRPAASAPGCASGSASRSRVVVTDTFGRPWRYGLTDVAIGVAGLAPLDDHRGRVDAHGNELGIDRDRHRRRGRRGRRPGQGQARARCPVAVVRGPAARRRPPTDGPGAAALVRPAGRGHVPATAPRDVVTVRGVPSASSPTSRSTGPPYCRAVAAAVTAPAPHHTHAVAVRARRGSARRANGCSTRCADAWATDLRRRRLHRGAGRATRPRRGDVLRRAPYCRRAVPGRRRRARLPRRAARQRRARDVRRRRRRRRAEPAGRAGRRGARLGLGVQHDVLPRRRARRARPARRTGTRWAPSRSAVPWMPSPSGRSPILSPTS